MNKNKLNQILEDARDNAIDLYNQCDSIRTRDVYEKELETLEHYLKEENQVALAMSVLRDAMKDKSEGELYHAWMCNIKFAIVDSIHRHNKNFDEIMVTSCCEEGARVFLDRLLQEPDNG